MHTPSRHHTWWLLADLTAAVLFFLSGQPMASGQDTAQLTEVTILQTTDLHGYVEDSDEVPGGGGMLRISTLIGQQREQAGAANTLLIDCGDAVQGSLHAAVTKGQIAIDLLNHMAYDVFVPGNHELDFGVKRCIELLNAFKGQVLCGNLQFPLTTGTVEYRPWRLYKRAGARIAVIGVTSGHLENWFWGDDYSDFKVRSALSTVEQLMPDILALKPDMIILAAHQGWLPDDTRNVNEIREIAWRFPEIDLILGGHTHWEHAGTKIGPTTWYMQAGRHADNLGVAVASIDTEEHQVVNITSKLLVAAPEVEIDATAAEAVKEDLAKAARIADEIVGTLAEPLSPEGTVGIDCQTSEFLSQAIAAVTGADIVVHGRLSGTGADEGPLTEGELFQLVPYENVIGIARLSQHDLKRILTEQIANRESYVACGVYGVVAHVNDNGAVKSFSLPDGTAPPEYLTVAFNSYTLAGGGGRFPILREIVREPDAKLRDTGLETREILRRFLQSNPNYRIKTQSWFKTIPQDAEAME